MSKFDRIRSELSIAIAIARLRPCGVKVRKAARCLSQPIVTRYANSQITNGERLVATNQIRGNTSGVRGRAVLRTLPEPASLIVGDYAVTSGTVVCAASSVRIGIRQLFGADSSVFDTDSHNRDPRAMAARPAASAGQTGAPSARPSSSGRFIFGARAIMAKSVAISSGSSIATGSIVTHDISPDVVLAGVPTRVVGDVQSWNTDDCA